MGIREEMNQNRGATSESIDALPTYKFKLKRRRSGLEGEINTEGQSEVGILAAGTDKERIILAEDAVSFFFILFHALKVKSCHYLLF